MAKYELDDSHFELLQRLCEAMDRCDQARDAVQEQGVSFRDRFGGLRPNPATAVEVQNRAQVTKFLQMLKLGEEDAPSASRAATDLARKRWGT